MNGKTDRLDVLVIGSGAAGAAVTRRLAELGAAVMCLEQGGWRKASDYPSMGIDYDAQMRRPRFSFNPNIRKQAEDYPVVSAGQDPPEIEMANCVGGTTVHWTCEFLRLHRSDFRTKSLDGVGRDWPIQYEDLESHYDAYDHDMGVSGILGDPANPIRANRLPPLPLGAAGRIAAKAFNRLGWHWWILDSAFLSRPYEGRSACNLNGQGWYGCGADARASTDITHWPKALRHGAILQTHARVREIITDYHGRALGAIYYDEAGNPHKQLARVVVICANGIGTPRLLLNSKSKRFPDGLANSSGLVGRGLMLHVGQRVRGILPACVDSYQHPMYVPLFSQEFYETDPRLHFSRGYTLLVRGTGGPLGTALGTKVPWGRDHHRIMRTRFPHMVSVTALGEDLPDEANRVELDQTTRDSDGIPAARVVYSISENSREMLRHGVQKGREILLAAGATEIQDEDPYPWTSHFMGTARMGTDPKTSVVDAWHQAHDVPNLFLVDGSSFVTSGAVGPTPTIGALALRCADGIWQRRREWT